MLSEEQAASQGTAGRQPAPSGSGEAVRSEPVRVRRGWRVYVAVGALAMVTGVAATTGGARWRAGVSAASAIPSPAAANAAFVADDNGTGADNQANILRYTIHGLVHVLAGLFESTTRVLAGRRLAVRW